MKLTDVIQELAKILDDRGDLTVVIEEDGGFVFEVIEVKVRMEESAVILVVTAEELPIDEATG